MVNFFKLFFDWQQSRKTKRLTNEANSLFAKMEQHKGDGALVSELRVQVDVVLKELEKCVRSNSGTVEKKEKACA